MSEQIIIGNLVILVSSTLLVLCAFFKNRRKTITGQSLANLIAAIGNSILGGFSGVVINLLGCIRNLLSAHDKLTRPLQIAYLACVTIGVVAVSQGNLLGFLPLVSTYIYTFTINIKNPQLFKFTTILVLIPWMIYDFSIHSYTGFFFDTAMVIGNISSIIRLRTEPLQPHAPARHRTPNSRRKTSQAKLSYARRVR